MDPDPEKKVSDGGQPVVPHAVNQVLYPDPRSRLPRCNIYLYFKQIIQGILKDSLVGLELKDNPL